MERWAVVTAGAQGLGGAIVEHLAANGFRVIAHYHRQEPVLAGVDRVRADLSAREGRESLMREVEARTPALDLLVNNLGVYPLEHLLETSLETWEQTFSLTCTAVFHLTQLALPLLRRAPRAAVINIGDSGADRVEAHDDATPYHIAKLGVHVLTRSYAARLGPEGISVNMISPGFLENSVGQPDFPLPMGRKGSFGDILAALDFLISDRARYVSGANLVVSGGWNL